MPEKILLDTDIGSDIDDAVCLAYLLAQPNCDLLGITTVTGEAVKRAQMASAQCRVAGRGDIPIYPGAEPALMVKSLQPQAPQAAMLDKWPHESDFPAGEAVEFLRSTIRAHPGEITLLAIGPLTNIALLFLVDPAIPGLLKQLVLMNGDFTARHNEWNVRNDPHASAIVYQAATPVTRAIGLDVTTKVVMPAAEVRQRFDTPLLRPVRDFAEVWFSQRPEITFHDPLAAVTIFEDDVCGFERGTITVNLGFEKDLGKTHWSPGVGWHEAALTVESERFFERFFSVFA